MQTSSRLELYLKTRRFPAELFPQRTRLLDAFARRRALLAGKGQPSDKLNEFRKLAEQLEK